MARNYPEWRKIVQERRAKGLCILCGEPGYVGVKGVQAYCPAHRERMHKYMNERRELRIMQGLCPRCGVPLGPLEEHIMCFQCRMYYSEYRAKERERNGK